MSLSPISAAPMASKPALPWLTRRRGFALLACYFALQALLRVLVSPSAELDESEQLMWSQVWSWGYGSDPPLYTWAQILAFSLLGTNVLGLAVLKNAFLLLAFLFTYYAAMEVTREGSTSVLAMLSLMLFPQITWESQRDLTHSVLATAVAAGTLFFFLRASRTQSLWAFVGLGTCLAAGTLSKYSYCLFALAMLPASLTLSRFRKALLGRGFLLWLTIFVVLTAPHFQWILANTPLAFSRPADLVHSTGGWHVRAWLTALLSIPKCALMVGGVLSLAYLLVFRGCKPNQDDDVREQLQLIWRTLLFVLVTCLAIVSLSAVELRDRWFQPIVFLLAIAAAIQVRDRVTPVRARAFFILIASLAGLVLLILPGIPLAAALTHRPTRLNAPYAGLAAKLRPRLPELSLIVADSRLTGGNLRFCFPKTTVIAPEFHNLPLPRRGPWLVVWNATRQPGPNAALLDLAVQLGQSNLVGSAASYVEAPLRYCPQQTMKLGYVLMH
jgi:4-amino-4-deoxy-L-arabinose transferase-like glycosyltransferase